MTRSTTLRFATVLIIGALAACTAEATPSPSAEPTEVATPTEEPSPTASATQSAEPAETSSPSPSDGTPGGGFTVAPNAEADSLFLARDDCQNVEDGYQLQFPEAWSTNDRAGDLPPCSWFAAGAISVDDPSDIPDDVAITIELLDGGDSATREDPISEEEVIVGGTQTAIRTEFEDEGTTMFEYIVQLGPTLEEGPVLLARTDTDMGGDYDLNKAVLDRIMATIEFIGTIQ